jgi:LmbE family N-acetylglucosaminyl deacetylase
MNVLVLAPHPDDEAIGCGGAICAHAAGGDRVTTVFLTSGELGLKHLAREEAWRIRESEAQMAAKVLGLADLLFMRGPDWCLNEQVADTAQQLAKIIEDLTPNVVYFPHPDDAHPDHQVTADILGLALGDRKKPPEELLGYEVWTPLGAFDHAVDISSFMARKLRAVRCYQSQLPGFHYDRAVRGLNQYRGCLATRTRYAEVFRRFEASELIERARDRLKVAHADAR